MDDGAETLIEAIHYFADPTVCDDYMREIRWPGGSPVCPKCGATGERVGEIKSRRKLICLDCKCQFSSRLGTPLGDSPLTLAQWFVGIWAVANDVRIGSPALGKLLGIEQKSAWLLVTRIRIAKEIADAC